MSNWPLPQRIVGEIIEGIVPVKGRRAIDSTYPLGIIRKSGYHRDEINEISLVTVEVWSSDLDEAEGLSDAIFTALIDGRSVETPEGILDRARCDVSPQEIPSEDPDLFCVSGVYRVVTRRQD